MTLLVFALVALLLTGAVALALMHRPRLALAVAAAGSVAAATAGLIAVARLLLPDAPPLELTIPWSLPYATLRLRLDALGAFFLLPVFVLCPLATIYATAYLHDPKRPAASASAAALLNWLTASMILVVGAADSVLFLIAWEAMALTSFGLVFHQAEGEEAVGAGLNYLIASQVGAAALLFFFVLLGGAAGSGDFAAFAAAPRTPALTAALFVLALVGFGTKAGLVPLHVWLPDAHPAAPSHVSAVMSGAMIKLGIYGLLRTFGWLAPLPEWTAWLLLAAGVVSGAGGSLLALAQRDLKRLLAYCSVENIGLIATGLGLGLLGQACDRPVMAALGFAGALLHVLNHALAKGLLFLAAGAVVHATGTRDMEPLGGLLKRLPKTGAMFLLGAAALIGLPPLNGFMSEFLIALAALRGILDSTGRLPLAGTAVLTTLALAGGLALAAFARAFGSVFLGEPRQDAAGTPAAHEPARAMTWPLLLLGALCVAAALLAPWIVAGVLPQPLAAAGVASPASVPVMAHVGRALGGVVFCFAAFALLAGALAFARRRALAGRPLAKAGTWDCGYAAPTARMQYTGSSFAAPLVGFFGLLLRTRRRLEPPLGHFPTDARLETETRDPLMVGVYLPLARLFRRTALRGRVLQHGNVQLYVLYIALALLAMLLWMLS